VEGFFRIYARFQERDETFDLLGEGSFRDSVGIVEPPFVRSGAICEEFVAGIPSPLSYPGKFRTEKPDEFSGISGNFFRKDSFHRSPKEGAEARKHFCRVLARSDAPCVFGGFRFSRRNPSFLEGHFGSFWHFGNFGRRISHGLKAIKNVASTFFRRILRSSGNFTFSRYETVLQRPGKRVVVENRKEFPSNFIGLNSLRIPANTFFFRHNGNDSGLHAFYDVQAFVFPVEDEEVEGEEFVRVEFLRARNVPKLGDFSRGKDDGADVDGRESFENEIAHGRVYDGDEGKAEMALGKACASRILPLAVSLRRGLPRQRDLLVEHSYVFVLVWM
jgi:hypothetical protein